MAFVDDVYVATPICDRVGPIHTTLDVDLYFKYGTQLHSPTCAMNWRESLKKQT